MRIRWPGYSSIEPSEARICELTSDLQIGLSLRRLERDALKLEVDNETAVLLLQGQVRLRADHVDVETARSSVFERPQGLLLVPGGTRLSIDSAGQAELALVSVPNPSRFSPIWFGSDTHRSEQRGLGMWGDAAHREVRTLVDDTNGPAEGQLVLGEVMAGPGRWSSYPPHFHEQPELYHYRFSHPSGYGHAELSEDVHQVRTGDTVLIEPGKTHAQCAAPGYGMWYLWAIRHLPDSRYSAPTFSEEHRWLLERPDS